MTTARIHLSGMDDPVLLPAIGTKANGCTFSGILTGADGQPYALALVDQLPLRRMPWTDAMAWAKTLDSDLPTRPEAALLFALLRSEFEQAWHWTNETVAWNASYAWNCDFDYGHQFDGHKSYEGCARAVRRFPIQSFNPSMEQAAAPVGA